MKTFHVPLRYVSFTDWSLVDNFAPKRGECDVSHLHVLLAKGYANDSHDDNSIEQGATDTKSHERATKQYATSGQ